MFALNICLAINLIILFVAFFFRKNNTLPNKILALILLDTAISFLGNASIVGGYFTEFPYIFFLSWCTSAFFGPLFFSYTCLFTGSGLNFRHPVWLVGIATCVFGLSFPVSYILLPPFEQSAFVLSLIKEPLPWQMGVINVMGMLAILGSMYASARETIKYKRRLVKTLSNLEKTKLTFITQFVLLGCTLTVATTILYLILPQHLVEYLYLPCLITLIYFFILFYTFSHHALFTAESYTRFLQDILAANEVMSVEYTTVELPLNELQILAQRLDVHLTESEAFTNPDLTLNMLARQLMVSSEKLSAAINKIMHKTFFDLINERRVEKSKALLNNKVNVLTIEAIAYEAGFNSRASFYRAFKRCTAVTPTAYLSGTSS